MGMTEFGSIPTALTELPQWVTWRREQRDGRTTKVPYDACSGRRASSTDPTTWTNFETAVARAATADGIGFVFTAADPIVGIDLDHAFVDGHLEHWAAEIVAELNSYTEVSPSGTGVHIYVTGQLPRDGRRSGNVEIYSEGRYFTVTGVPLPGAPPTVEERSAELAAIHARLFSSRPKVPRSGTTVSAMVNTGDVELLARARNARDGGRFTALFDRGDTSWFNRDSSKADMALCRQLVFWCGRDPARIDRLFRQSALMRPKWDARRGELTYGERTIRTAIGGASEIYAGVQRPSQGARIDGHGRSGAATGTSADSPAAAEPSAFGPNAAGQIDSGEDGHGLDVRLARLNTTDVGNAKRLVVRFGDDIRYCPAWGWMVWDGARWRPDDTARTMEFAKKTVRAILREAAATGDHSRRGALAAWAARSETFDADPWKLNCANGTIDMRTGKLYPHRREDLITKLAPVAYDPQAASPQWDRFLARILPEPALRRYVQQAAGYALTGSVREQCLFLHGGGANGKTTFLNALRHVVGGYGKQAAPDLLIAKRDSQHPCDVADLCGARLVVTSEVDDGRRFAEGLVKQLTGGDQIKARLMRKDFFDFEPTHKIFLAANHRPTIRGTDHGIWRRIKLIPFTETIADSEKDPDLGDKLRAEAAGILRWAVEGCRDWHDNGLVEADAVRSATADYRDASDVVSKFLAETCELGPKYQESARALHAACAEWTNDSGEFTISIKRLGTALAERGLRRARSGATGSYRWYGIRLRSVGAPQPPPAPEYSADAVEAHFPEVPLADDVDITEDPFAEDAELAEAMRLRRLEAPQTNPDTEATEQSELVFGMNAIEPTHKEVIRDSRSDRSVASVSSDPGSHSTARLSPPAPAGPQEREDSGPRRKAKHRDASSAVRTNALGFHPKPTFFG